MMKLVARAIYKSVAEAQINYFDGEIKTLGISGLVDSYIVSSEEGFSPLGSNLSFLAADLGIATKEIKSLADWNRFENPHVSLIAIPSRNPQSHLKGLILSACESSRCYSKYAMPRYGKPYRDFYYNLTYEAISYAVNFWACRNLAISHLSCCNSFHSDIATCNVEAFLHLFQKQEKPINSLTFLRDCDIEIEMLTDARHLVSMCATNGIGAHDSIFTTLQSLNGYTVINLSLPRGRNRLRRVT